MANMSSKWLVDLHRYVPTRRERRRRRWQTVTRTFARVARASWLVVVLAAGAVMTVSSMPSRTMHACYAYTPTDRAGLAVNRYVRDGFPAWRAKHPGQACPTSLHELDEFSDSREGRDPWGQHFLWSCSAAGLVVWSTGADRINETADDISSAD